MVELLTIEKRALLALGVELTDEHFELAWQAAWTLMVHERAFPHATIHRRSWRAALIGTKPEMCACFVGRETGFARYLAALAEAMDQSSFADESVTGELVA
jgi:hypothetical protein